MNHCRTERRNSVGSEIKRIICKALPLQLLHRMLEEKITEVPYTNAEYAINFFGAYRERECVPKSVFGKPKLYEFGSIEVYGPADGDAYLRSLYGDFMTLPPVEQRVNKHDFYFLDLSNPYNQYRDR